MTLAENTTAANDAERTGVAPPSTTPPADPDAQAKILAAEYVAKPWDELTPATRDYWRKKARESYDPATQSKLKDGNVVDITNPKAGVVSESDPPEPPKGSGKATYVAEPTHEIPATVDSLLTTILSWPRRHASASEFAFCKFVRQHIKQLTGQEPAILAEGCIVAEVKRPAKASDPTSKPAPSTTLFSCHVDTIEDQSTGTTLVDNNGTLEPIRKQLNYDPNFGLIGLEKESIGGSLGADDGAGVWLMLKMIERKVPGTYIFHRGEEVGCIGSRAMVEKYTELLKAYECAVAFDRHDTFEVIRVQGGSTCASMKFTEALCARLNKQGMRYEPSSRGVLTDVKHYRKIIPECVNLAVGYQSQHGRNETLDYAHLAALLEACCAIEWDSLPIDRDPAEVETTYGGYQSTTIPWTQWRRGGGRDDLFADDDDGFVRRNPAPQLSGKKKKKQQQQTPRVQAPAKPMLTVSEELGRCTLEELETWAVDHPIQAAKAMGQLLVEIATLKASNEAAMSLLGFNDDDA